MSSELNEEHINEDYVNQQYVSIPDWHMAIIQERLARYEAEGTTWTPWEEVERELLEEFEHD